MKKAKISPEILEKLDKINAAEGLKQVSLGNLLRGIEYLVDAFEDLKVCLQATAEEIKKNVEKIKKEKEEQQNDGGQAKKKPAEKMTKKKAGKKPEEQQSTDTGAQK